jgi:DNA-binding NarL/FixJ family response regulator
VSAEAVRPSVAIVDEHPITAAGITAQLAGHGLAVAGVAAAVESLTASADAVVCDLRLPGRSGPDAVAFLVERGYRVLATSGVAGPEEILDVIAGGARGFVAKTAPIPAFMQAIRDIIEVSYFVSPELAYLVLTDAELRPLGVDDIGATERAVLRQFLKGDTAGETAAALALSADELADALSVIWTRARARRIRLRPTPRERQLMTLVARGCSHKEAATQMSITALTVAGYLKSIKSKYLAAHPDVPESIAPLSAARRWAEEIGPITGMDERQIPAKRDFLTGLRSISLAKRPTRLPGPGAVA